MNLLNFNIQIKFGAFQVQTDNFSSQLDLAKQGSENSSTNPVDDLDEGDDAEAKAEAKEPSKGGCKVHRAHPDAPLQLCNYYYDVLRHVFLTHDSVLAKEDVDKSNILLPGVVELILDGK